jgi:glycosyltransferase involved in cell wall biosynthesis
VNRRIRVLRVIARLNVGGPAMQAALLTERLDPARYDSLLVTGREDAAEGNFLRLHGRSLAALEVIPELGRELRLRNDGVALARLVKLMRERRPDIVHTHTAKAGTLGRVAARLARVPRVVHTYHGHVFDGYFSPARTRTFVAIERWLGRFTDRLVAVSEAVARDLGRLRIGTPARTVVLPLGLDLEPFLRAEALRGEFRAELGIGRDVPLVGIVARLVPIKRHEDVLHAVALLVTAMPACRVVVVGDGERRQPLEALARRLGLDGVVTFLGWRRDLDRIYADLDVAVLGSLNEGSPVSLIEAMAAARPVVATAVGGVPDLVDDEISGRLVRPGDPRALADAMRGVLVDRDLGRRMGLAGRKQVHPAFASARLLDDVNRLYGELLAAGAG